MKERIQITDPRIQKGIELYKAGMAMRPISKELKLDEVVLKRFLERSGVELRKRGEAVRAGKSKAKINDNALDILTPEALYWIGFLYADGHIEKDRPRISITVSEPDKPHLEKFRKFFGKDIPVIQTQKEGMRSNGYVCSAAYRVCFSSKKIHQKLVDLGFTNRKTWDITPHELLKNSHDFWRGVVDGDGWVINKPIPVVGVCGHENTVREFLLFSAKSGLIVEATAKKEKRRDFLWKTDLRARGLVISVLKILYKDACVYLDRKYEKYLEIVKT